MLNLLSNAPKPIKHQRIQTLDVIEWETSFLGLIRLIHRSPIASRWRKTLSKLEIARSERIRDRSLVGNPRRPIPDLIGWESLSQGPIEIRNQSLVGNPRRSTPDLSGWENLYQGPIELVLRIPLATRPRELLANFLITYLIRILMNLWKALTTWNPLTILRTGHTTSTYSWKQCTTHLTWSMPSGSKQSLTRKKENSQPHTDTNQKPEKNNT